MKTLKRKGKKKERMKRKGKKKERMKRKGKEKEKEEKVKILYEKFLEIIFNH